MSTRGGLERADGGPLLFGVCAQLARALALRPRWLRLAFLVLTAATWVGPALYAALALLLPAPEEEGLSWSERLGLRGERLGRGARELGERLVEGLVTWRDLREGASAEGYLRSLIGGGALVIGGLWLLDSFGLLVWLTGPRALALTLMLIGVGLLRAWR